MSQLSNRQQRLLTASLAVHRVLVLEQDLPSLLQAICDELVKDGLNRAAWIVLLETEVGGVITAETGLGDRLGLIMDQLKQSRIPACGREALEDEQGRAVLCHACDCGVCRREPAYGPVVAAAIRCRQGLVGFLAVELPPDRMDSPVELSVYGELAQSVGHGLRRLFDLEELRQQKRDLQQMEERFRLALDASQAGLWDWNIKTGEMYASPEGRVRLDYRKENGQQLAAIRGSIHPDDQERVLRVLNDHLAGKTDEYRIEYRVRGQDGEWRWFLDRGRVVERDENNKPVRMTGTHQDITRQKRQEEALAAVQKQLHEAVNHERAFLQTVIDGAADPVMAIDTNYTVLLINRVAARLLRVDTNMARSGKKCYELFCNAEKPCNDSRYPCPVRAVQESGEAVRLVHNPYHGNGINNTFELEVSPLRDREGIMYGVIEVARDITDRLRIEKELRASQSRLYRLAHHDALTGLPNRLLFKDRLEQAMHKARRAGKKVGVLFLDLDRFKEINDTLGHDVGDELLVEVAERLQRQCRQSDTVARLGGDEFIFVLEDLRSRDNAALVARKLLDAMAEPVQVGQHRLQVSTSIGIAMYPDDATDLDSVVKCADLALYQAKEQGRRGYVLYDPVFANANGKTREETSLNP